MMNVLANLIQLNFKCFLGLLANIWLLAGEDRPNRMYVRFEVEAII
jgi:hypothetical protein